MLSSALACLLPHLSISRGVSSIFLLPSETLAAAKSPVNRSKTFFLIKPGIETASRSEMRILISPARVRVAVLAAISICLEFLFCCAADSLDWAFLSLRKGFRQVLANTCHVDGELVIIPARVFIFNSMVWWQWSEVAKFEGRVAWHVWSCVHSAIAAQMRIPPMTFRLNLCILMFIRQDGDLRVSFFATPTGDLRSAFWLPPIDGQGRGKVGLAAMRLCQSQVRPPVFTLYLREPLDQFFVRRSQVRPCPVLRKFQNLVGINPLHVINSGTFRSRMKNENDRHHLCGFCIIADKLVFFLRRGPSAYV